jgi:hypothetical protein
MEFSESSQEWRPVPAWVEWLVGCGFGWPNDQAGGRRIAIVSMPCDSAAAGLISLGSLVRDLCREDADDTTVHADALMGFALQYLTWCQNCTLKCNPVARNCGFLDEASGLVRNRDGYIYRISRVSKDPRWSDAIVCSNRRETKSEERLLFRHGTADWHVEGEPTLSTFRMGTTLDSSVYAPFAPSSAIRNDNLQRSYSGLCLAGRAAGESVTRDRCASIRFHMDGVEHNLANLLTIHGWRDTEQVSRMSFFNTRTGRFDRHACSPAIVVCDGIESTLRVLEHRALQRADVIGVFNRTVERSSLELLGNKLAELRQWYDKDAFFANNPPRGIGVATLRRRGA